MQWHSTVHTYIGTRGLDHGHTLGIHAAHIPSITQAPTLHLPNCKTLSSSWKIQFIQNWIFQVQNKNAKNKWNYRNKYTHWMLVGLFVGMCRAFQIITSVPVTKANISSASTKIFFFRHVTDMHWSSMLHWYLFQLKFPGNTMPLTSKSYKQGNHEM